MLLVGAVCAAIVFLPGEGRIGAPLHDFVTILLGPASFVLPLGLGFVGVLVTLRTTRPQTHFPRKRLFGVALVTGAVIAGEHLLGGTSLVGQWLTSWLIETLGIMPTVALVAAIIVIGTWLTFDVRLPVWRRPRAAAS